MTEVIRYSRLGEEDINFGLGTFEVRLADGRVVLLQQVDVGAMLNDAARSTRAISLDTLTVNSLVISGTPTDVGSLRVPNKADPGSPSSGELWINPGGTTVEYADDTGTPVARTFVAEDTTQTLTNKTLSLASNTLTGNTAQFNSALTDGNFATQTGVETLTNKTLTTPVVNGTVTGTYTLGGTPTIPGALTAGTPCAQDPCTASSTTTTAHGLGAMPTLIVAYYECKSAELGYVAGDRIFVPFVDSAASRGASIQADATNVNIVQDNNFFAVVSKTTNVATVITPSKWKLVAVPYKLT